MSFARPTWVCLGCQIANKGGGTCPECHRPMECIGHSWAVPRRGHRDWRLVEQLVARKRRNMGPGSRTRSPTCSSNDSFGPADSLATLREARRAMTGERKFSRSKRAVLVSRARAKKSCVVTA